MKNVSFSHVSLIQETLQPIEIDSDNPTVKATFKQLKRAVFKSNVKSSSNDFIYRQFGRELTTERK